MTISKKFTFLIFISLLIFVASCTGGVSIREATDTELVTSSDWSARDLKRVARYMAGSIRDSRLVRSSKFKKNKPRWILTRQLKNNTDEHVNTRLIMEKVRTKLINRGLARFIDDQAIDDIMAQHKMQQSDLYNSKQVAKIGRLVGAKLILRGTISNIRKRSSRTDINYFNITLQVVDIETMEIVWTDEKEIQRITQK